MTIQEILQEIKKIADNNSFVNFSYIGDVEEMKLQPGFEYPGFAVQNYSYDEETKTYYLSMYLISEDKTLEQACLNAIKDIVYNVNLKHLDLGIVIKSDNIQIITAGKLNGAYCSMQLQMTLTSCVCEDKPGYVSSVNGQTGDVILDIPKAVSDLKNDSGFIDSEYVDNLIEQLNSSVNTNYVNKSELSEAISEEVLRSDNKYAEKTELDNYVTNSSVNTNYLKKVDYVEPDVNLDYVNDKFNTLNSSINEHFQVKGNYATETYVDSKIETLNSSIVQNYIKKGEVPEDVYSKTEVDELFTEYSENVESTYTKKDYLETRILDISSAIDDGIVSANEYTNGQIETVESDFSTKLNNVNSSVNNEFNRVWEKENTQDSEISNINNFISSVPDNYVLITYYNEDKENIKAEINSVDTKIDNINSSTAEAFETVAGQISNISEHVSTIEDDYVKHEEITDFATRLAVDMSNIDPAGEQKVKDIISTEGYIKEIPPLTDYVTKEYLQNVYDSSFYDKIGNGPYLKGNSGILNITVYDKILYSCEEITITATYQSLPFQGTVYQNNGLKITNLAQPGETQDFNKNIGLLINNNFGNIKYITPGETLSFTAEETKTFTNIQFINYGFNVYGDGHVLLEQLGNVYDSLNDWLNSKQYINKSYAEKFITQNLFSVALDEINENINAVSTKIDDVGLRTDSSILILNSSVNKIENAGFVTGTYISDNYYNKTEIDDKGYLDKTTADIYYQEKGNYVDEIAYSNKVSEIDSSISDISTRLAGIKIPTDYVKTADYSADKEAQATKDSEQDSNIATANLNISQVDAKVDNINSSTAEAFGTVTGQISNVSGRVQTIENDYVKHDEIEHFVTDSSVADNYARKSSLEGLITETDADNKYYGKTAGEGLYNYVHNELDREITDLHNKDLEIDSSISDVSARLKTVKDTVNGLDNIYVKSETYNIDKNAQAEVNQDVTTKLGKINTAIGTLNSSVNAIENAGYATQTWVSSQGYLDAVDKTELEGKINDKQDAGDYATNTRVNEVEGKIPEVKDFVTNSSISTNYYNKTEIDNKGYLNKVTADGYYQEKGNYVNETVYSNKVSEIDSSISDISARLKTANDNIANKADQSELANYYTKPQGTALEGRVSSAEQNITGLQENVQTLDSKIQTDYVSNSSISTNYYMKKDVYNKQETEDIVEILRTDMSSTYEQKGHYDSAIYTLNTSVNKVETKIQKKQDKLVSGTNIKTINNESILGSGNIEVKGKEHISLTYAEWEALSYDEQMADKVYLIKDAENVYQAPLVSGTNIKTINGNSILGEGNIEIQGGSGGGTSKHQNITQAEYDALTPEQKQADIVYFITDADVVYATTAYVDEKIGNINTILESI